MNCIHPSPLSPYPLYVIILNWNLAPDTIQCVESVRADMPPGVEIVIVDNGSTDHSMDLLRECLGDTVMLIETGVNLGFAGGVNVGIQRALAAGAQSILLLNNDTCVDPSMILRLAWAASENPKSGIIGPVIYRYDQPQRIWRFADREYGWLPVPMQLPPSMVSQANGIPFQVDYVTACAMLIRRSVVEAVGLFDTSYFMYFEDADYCRRARRAGYEIWCVPQARMWHKVSASARKQKPATRYAQAWGRAHFYRNYPHGPWQGLTLAYLFGKSAVMTIQDMWFGDWILTKSQWMGTLDGVCDRPSRYADFLK
jgi:GT2 family glycosyltransferase